MTANNPDQDDYDPSFDESAEDFGYEEESFGDEGFGDEESWDENSEDGGDGTPAEESSAEKPQKKKGGLFNVVLIALAVLGGGAFIYLKVLAPSSGPAQPSTMAEMPVETQQAALPVERPVPVPEAMPEQPVPVASVPEDTLLPAPADIALEAPALVEAPPALMPEPDLTPPAEQQPVEVASAPPMPAPIAAPEPVPEVAIRDNNGFNPGLPSAKDIMIAPPAPEAAAATAGSISADAAKGIEQKLSVLLARLDTFENRITNLESGLHQVSSKISTLESKPAPATDLDGVNKALQALERKISGLEATSATPASAAATVADVTVDTSKIDKPTFVPATPDKSQAQKTVSAADTPKEATAPKPVSVSPQPHVTGWALRSAQPGSAMVVPKAGGDMRTIRVGDSLSGLGRITAIELRGSKWVVQGTQGTLTH